MTKNVQNFSWVINLNVRLMKKTDMYVYTSIYQIFVYKNDKRIRKQYNYQYKYTSKKGEQKITKCKQLWFLQENIITVRFFFIKMRKSMKLNRLSTGMWDCKDKSAGICQKLQRL